MRFKYKYENLDCSLCSDMADAGCPHEICPYVMDNLKDLRLDRDFIESVEDAEILTPLRPTLLHLNRIGFPEELPRSANPSPQLPYNHGVKPECAGCPYLHVGLFCYGKDGTCIKTDLDETLKRDRKRCPA